MTGDHVMVEQAGDDPAVLARGIARHPSMRIGGPLSFERAAACAMGVEIVLISTV